MGSFLYLLNSNDQQTADTFYLTSRTHVGPQGQNQLPNLGKNLRRSTSQSSGNFILGKYQLAPTLLR